ncbi:ATP synthase F1 subunit gamma [Blattabacterium cuenoti]|uniref:ATP synthase F1 subunit gamma n=1 Tax=Blattabacterium cuenoti TaxID=1653831 RepID=UPI00163C7328|nr:ATP synthase F1 subunit gamma [Blattabacterium cuenoti]
MSNPKEIKRRILSIESVIKTTEAMKMISIVKLRKIKNLLIQIKIYLDYIETILLDLLFMEKYKENLSNNQYFTKIGKEKMKLFIVFTSDRGLCGSFNSSIFEKINFIFHKKGYNENECVFLSVGKKGFDFLCGKYNMYNQDLIENNFLNKKIQSLTSELISDFIQKKFSAIYLIYNHLKKSLLQETIIEKFLPISIKNLKKKTSKIYSILEPDQKKILNLLIPKFLNTKLLKTFLESTTAEHTSRMISMHKATENAYDIKHDLILNYNKERQTAITKEILEIISGSESLK